MEEASESVGEDKDSFLKEFKKLRKELTLKYDAIN